MKFGAAVFTGARAAPQCQIQSRHRTKYPLRLKYRPLTPPKLVRAIPALVPALRHGLEKERRTYNTPLWPYPGLLPHEFALTCVLASSPRCILTCATTYNYIHSDVCSGMYSDMCSGICFETLLTKYGANALTLCLAPYLANIPTRFLTFYLWRMLFLAFCLALLLAFHLAYILTLFL